jgi:ribonuclease BN (tRNA processing enzyme)
MNVPPGSALSSSLEVVWIGTGTCVPRLDRRGPCTLVRCTGTAAAVDLGLGALHGLLHRGVRHGDLDAVLLTHLHVDHAAELVSFLFAANYDETPRDRPLTLAGGPGLKDFVGALSAAYGHWLEPKGYVLTLRELPPGEGFELGELRCRAGPARHIPSSVSYRFERGGRSLVISGDTGPSPELERFAAGAHLLVLEASLPPGGAFEAHLTARQAGELAARARARRLVLHHFYPSSDAASPKEQAAAAFRGPVLVAEDGMALAV